MDFKDNRELENQDLNEFLEQYRCKAKRLALLKSALCGSILGLIATFFVAFALFFAKLSMFSVVLLSIGSFIIVAAVSTVLLYFLRFQPSTQDVARMVDLFGLEERTITMVEMEKEQSNIAKLQRDDAKQKLSKVSPKLLKFRITKTGIAVLSVVLVLAAAMTTTSAISARRVASLEINDPSGSQKDPSKSPEEEEVYVEINYLAGEGGTVSGETYQRILRGKDATPVAAAEKEGFTFLQWSDGVMTKERWDWSVMEDLTVSAIFLKNSSGNGGNGQGEGGEGQEGEGGQDQEGKEPGEGEEGEGKEPGEEGEKGEEGGEGQEGQEGQQGQEGEQGGDGESGDEDGEGDGGEGGSQGENGNRPGEGQPSGGQGDASQGQGGDGAGAGGRRDDNSVLDGKTDYKEAVDYEKEKEKVENNDDLPAELKDALSGYFDGMKP